MTPANPDKICLSAAAERLGLTPRIAEHLLPPPELRPNPHSRKAPPMKLYSVSDVEAVVETEAYNAELAKRQKRAASAAKAVRTREEATASMMQKRAAAITVTVIPMDELRRRTLAAKAEWKRSWGDHDFCAEFADAATVNRWMVNYIRHRLTDYDDSLFDLNGKTGKDAAYFSYRETVLLKIAEAYPVLAEECRVQIGH